MSLIGLVWNLRFNGILMVPMSKSPMLLEVSEALLLVNKCFFDDFSESGINMFGNLMNKLRFKKFDPVLEFGFPAALVLVTSKETTWFQVD